MPAAGKQNTRAKQLRRARKKPVAPSGRPKGSTPPGHAGQSPTVKHYAKGPPKPKRAKPPTDLRSADRQQGDGTEPIYAQRIHGGKVVGRRRFINADSYRHYEDRLEHKAAKRIEAHASAEQEAKETTAVIPKRDRAAARDVAKAHARELLHESKNDPSAQHPSGHAQRGPYDVTEKEAKESGKELARQTYAVPRDPDDPVRRKRVRRNVRQAEKRILKENEQEKAYHEQSERKGVVPAGTSDAAAIAANRKADDKAAKKNLAKKVKGDIRENRRKGGVGRWLENAKDDVADTVTGAPASAVELAKVGGEQVVAVGRSIEAAKHPARPQPKADMKHTKALVEGVKESDPAYALLTGHPKEALMRIKERPVTGVAEFVPATSVLGKGARVVRSTRVARKTGETRQAVEAGSQAAKHARPALRTETTPRARPKTKAQRKAVRKQVKQTAQRQREAARAMAKGTAAPTPTPHAAKPRQHSPNIAVRTVAKAKDKAVAATGRDPNVAPKPRRFSGARRAADRGLNVDVRNVQTAGIGNEERVVTHAHKALPRSKRKSRAHRAAVQLLVDESIRPGSEVADLAEVEREVRLHGGEHTQDNLNVLNELSRNPDILKDEDVRKAAKSLAAESIKGDERSVAAGYSDADTLEHARRTRGALRRGEIRERNTESNTARAKRARKSRKRRGGGGTPPSPKPPKRDVLAEARADVPTREPEVVAMAEETGGAAPNQGEGRRPESAAAKAEAKSAQLQARAEAEVADVATTGTRHAEGGSGVVEVKHTEPQPRTGGSGRASVGAKLKAHQIELRNQRRNSKVIDEFVETTQAVVRLRGEVQGAPDTNATRIKKARLATWEARRAELARHQAVKKYVEGKKKERELQAEYDALPPQQNVPAHEATIGGDTHKPVEAVKTVSHGEVKTSADPGKMPAGQPGPLRGAEAESRDVHMIDGKPHVKKNGKWVRVPPKARKTGEVTDLTPESVPRRTEEDIAAARARKGEWTQRDEQRYQELRGTRTRLEREMEDAYREGDEQLGDRHSSDLEAVEEIIAKLQADRPKDVGPFDAPEASAPKATPPRSGPLTPKRVKPAGGEWVDVKPEHGEGSAAGRRALDDAKREQELPGRREQLVRDEEAVARAQHEAEQELAEAEASGNEGLAEHAQHALRTLSDAAKDNARRRRELDADAERKPAATAPSKLKASAGSRMARPPERKPAATAEAASSAASPTPRTGAAPVASQSSPRATAPAVAAERLPEPDPVGRAVKSLTPDVKVEDEAAAGVQELAQDFADSKARFEFVNPDGSSGPPVTLDELRKRHIGDHAGYVRGAKLEKDEDRMLGAPEAGDVFNVDDLFQPLGTGRVGATALEREQRITLANMTRTVVDQHAWRYEGKTFRSSDPQRIATALKTANEGGVKHVAFEIRKPGGGTESIILPDFLAKRVKGQLSEDGRIMRGARWGTRIAVRATLPFSVLWHAGNAIDLMVRLALTTPPGSIGEGRAIHAALSKQLETLSPDLRAHVLDSLKGHFGSRRTVRDPRFSDVLRDSRLEPIGKVTNALGDALKKTGGKAVDALFDFSSEIEKHLVNQAIGTEAKKYARELGIEVKDNVNAMRDLAGHLERDPAKVVELQDRILEIVGDFSTRSAMDRKILAGVDPYWNWMKAATRFVLKTLPEKHPKRTALLFIAAGLTDEERAKSGLNYYFDQGELDKLRRDLDYATQRKGFMSGSVGPRGEGVPTVPLTSFGEVANLLTQPSTLAGRPLSYLSRPATAAAGFLRTPGELALKALPGGGEVDDLRHYSDSFDRAAAMGSESILPGAKQARQVREGGVAPQRDSTFWDPKTIKGKRTPFGGANTVVNFMRSQPAYDKPVSAKEMDKRTPKVPVGQEFQITYEDELGNPRVLRVKRTH